jgi:putative spermidine/putrescine transport system permease protein
MAVEQARAAAAAPFGSLADAGLRDEGWRSTLAPPRLPRGAGSWLMASPALALLVMLLAVPTIWLVRLSLFESGAVDGSGARFYLPNTFTFEHYRTILSDRYFHAVAWSTARLSLVTAVGSMTLAYPLAVWIDRRSPQVAMAAVWLVALPKLTNTLVLLYGVLLLLGNAGLVNRALLAAGVVRAPLPLFANLPAVVAGEVLLILPYPLLMLVGVLRATGTDLEEAARGLGAGPLRAFLETTFRLSLPGAGLAFAICLVWAAGAFAAPLVLGNPGLYTVSVEVHLQTFERVNWPLAAALALVHLAAVGIVALLGLALGRNVARAPRHQSIPIRTKSPATGVALAPLRRYASARDRLGTALLSGGFHFYAGLALVMLLTPLLFSLLVSVTQSETIGLPDGLGGASLRWYAALLRDPLWLAALRNSVLTAAIAVAVAVPFGALAAVAIDGFPARHGRVVSLLLTVPLFTPGVVLGLQALALYYRLGIWGSAYGVGLAHAMWTMPLAFLVVRAALSGIDRRLEEAAAGLGANPFRAFWAVTMPRLWPSAGAAAFLCAVMSLNELPIALFLATPTTRTLPTLIWPQLRYSLTPLVAAASGVLLLLTVGGALASAALASPRLRLAWRRRG